MGPLSFLNGAFLAALAAAVLPILIHLFSRRRLREVPFSNLAFLDEVTRRKTRRMRMRQWLLLALRTLAIAFIALALSRPVWQGGGAGLRRGSSTMAILLDDSFSMEARLDPDGLLPVDASQSGLEAPTRFAQARRRAREALALLEEGDRAVLVFMAAPVQIPYGSTVRDPALLLEELERARPRPARADLAGALEQVYPLLSAATTLNREVLIISDFQQNQADEMLGRLGARTQAGDDRAVGGGGSGDDDDAPATEPGAGAPDSARYAAGPARLPVPEQTRLYLLPVSTEASSNVALSGALYEKDPAGRGGRLTVRLRNLGDDAAGDVTIQALGGGETGALLGEGVVDLEAGSAAQTVIALASEPEQGLLTV
ncbi:MAG: BatA domain-containing protein, partial [Candidatus Eisenbacteria bacterium]